MSTEIKACLIIPFYGKWPTYLPLFLKGCENNAWLDILFFTDLKTPKDLPLNVKVINLQMQEIEKSVASIFGFTQFSIPFHYKICDLRPLYAQIFANHINTYDYWAFGDCDLIFGNLSNFTFSKFEDKIDVIANRVERITGSLTFIRNTPINNTLFQKIENYRHLITTNIFEGIDETCHDWDTKPKDLFNPSSFTYVVNEHKNVITSIFETTLNEDLQAGEYITYNNGFLFFGQKEISYFHYVRNKIRPYFTYPNWEVVPNEFYICETGFYEHKWQMKLISPFKKATLLMLYYTKKLPSFLIKKAKKCCFF